MSGFQRSTLYPPAVPRHAGLDRSELDWRNEVRERTQRMMNPPIVPVPPLDTGMAKFVAFWSLPEKQRESILKAEQEFREQAESARLAEARQAEAERLGIAASDPIESARLLRRRLIQQELDRTRAAGRWCHR